MRWIIGLLLVISTCFAGNLLADVYTGPSTQCEEYNDVYKALYEMIAGLKPKARWESRNITHGACLLPSDKAANFLLLK